MRVSSGGLEWLVHRLNFPKMLRRTNTSLLYTCDAADELMRLRLGGHPTAALEEALECKFGVEVQSGGLESEVRVEV